MVVEGNSFTLPVPVSSPSAATINNGAGLVVSSLPEISHFTPHEHHRISRQLADEFNAQLKTAHVATYVRDRLHFTTLSYLSKQKEPSPQKLAPPGSQEERKQKAGCEREGGSATPTAPCKRLTVYEDEYHRRIFVRIGPSYVYRRFFADFGPFDLGTTVRFCRQLHALLNSKLSEGKEVYFCSSPDEHERANCSVLIGSYAIFCLCWSADESHRPLIRYVYMEDFFTLNFALSCASYLIIYLLVAYFRFLSSERGQTGLVFTRRTPFPSSERESFGSQQCGMICLHIQRRLYPIYLLKIPQNQPSTYGVS